jgi:hypothetical protein
MLKIVKINLLALLLLLGIGAFNIASSQEQARSSEIRMEELEVKGKVPRPQVIYIIKKAAFSQKRMRNKVSLIPYIVESTKENCLE